jgi:DNA transformation protein
MSDDFLAYLDELFSDFGPVTTRAMFGGHGVYHDGKILGIVIDDALYLKADAQTVPAFEAAGCAPFVYDAGGKVVAMSYWSLPAEAMDSSQAFLPWARRAWDAVLRKPIAMNKRAKRKRKPSER